MRSESAHLKNPHFVCKQIQGEGELSELYCDFEQSMTVTQVKAVRRLKDFRNLTQASIQDNDVFIFADFLFFSYALEKVSNRLTEKPNRYECGVFIFLSDYPPKEK